MSSDSTKREAFKRLFAKKWRGVLEKNWQNLDELATKLGDDDKKNALAIEEWVEKYPEVLSAYQSAYQEEEELQALSEQNSLLEGEDTEMGIRKSKAQPNSPSQSLDQLIKNESKKPTKIPEEYNKFEEKS